MTGILLVTAATPTANDSAIKGFFEGEGFYVEQIPSAELTPEKISLTTRTHIVTTPDCGLAGTAAGASLKSTAGKTVLLGRSGDADLVNGAGLAAGALNDYRVQNASVSQADIAAGSAAGNDVQVFSPTSSAYFLRGPKLGAGFVTIATDKTDATRKLVGYYPKTTTLAGGSAANNPIGWAALQNIGNATSAYRATVLFLLTTMAANL